MFSLPCITQRIRYHWVYIWFFNTNPCCEQAPGPCICVLLLVDLLWGKARYRQWTVSTMNFCWSDPKMGNADPFPLEGEGVEGADCCQFWLSLFVQFPENGWFPGYVSWRPEDDLILDGPMSSCREWGSLVEFSGGVYIVEFIAPY